ncbi:MAG: mandelate racemase/muconate lactonizing enzyme family protein [Pseudomonadota bacterium]
MRITKISVWALDLPLTKPYYLSGGRLRFDQLDSTFVRVDTDEGLSGWGEGCPWGHTYTPAHGPGVRAGVATLAPALIGRDPRALQSINRLMDEQLPGHPYVKSALDIACWDILGQASGMPLWMLMGAEAAEGVAVNSSISTGSPEEMIALIEAARAKGYGTHSAKIGGADTNADIDRINAISAALIPGENVTFDVNRAWTPSAALQVLNAVDDMSWVEQPCETLEQCAYVAGKVRQPVLLDECLHTFQDHLNAWRGDACAGAKIKPNRLGGLTRAMAARDFGVSVGWRMHIEDLGGSALADTAAIHLAAATPAPFRMASWLCHDHLVVDPCPGQGARNIDGFAAPPSAPGLGVAPDLEILGEPEVVYQ